MPVADDEGDDGVVVDTGEEVGAGAIEEDNETPAGCCEELKLLSALNSEDYRVNSRDSVYIAYSNQGIT